MKNSVLVEEIEKKYVLANGQKISEDIKDTLKRYKVCNTYERGKLLHVGTFLSETI